MFDRLIVSEPAGAGSRSRRNYFLVSTLAVGALFLTAVIASIFAEELSLGTDAFELSVMLMPVEPPAVRPETPRPNTPAPQTAAQSPNQLPTRQVNMSRIDEPTIVPTAISTAPNTQLSRPNVDRFRIGAVDSGPSIPAGTGRDTSGIGDGPGGLQTAHQVAQTTPDETPPPVRTPHVPPVVSRGVINGEAAYLPKPNYPPAALAVRVEGKVDVQVLIDESGKVVSAKAVSGNAMLREAAERAARTARFTPTKLSDVPVKVTGVIVYNFTRG
jgi:periplasmic protein TonB